MKDIAMASRETAAPANEELSPVYTAEGKTLGDDNWLGSGG
jgi:hypothetical protein